VTSEVPGSAGHQKDGILAAHVLVLERTKVVPEISVPACWANASRASIFILFVAGEGSVVRKRGVSAASATR
jgi:hypothetical protein